MQAETSPARRVLAAVVPLVPLLALLALFFFPALLGRDLVATDTRDFVGARDRLLAASLASGQGLPQWAPGVCGGAAAWAAPQLGLAYPPTVVLAWLDPERAPLLGLVLHLLVGALGARALARELGLGASAATFASVAYGFSGPFVSGHAMPLLVASNGWLPWVAWGVARAARGPGSGLVAATLAQLAILVSGDPQNAAFAGLGALGVAVAARPREARRALGAVVLASLAALLLGAVSLVPAAVVFPEHARRSGLAFETATRWSLGWAELPGLLVPYFLGARAHAASVWADATTPDHARTFLEALYVGPLVLGLGAVALASRPRSAAARAGAVVALACLPLALGANLPGYAWLFAHPPTSWLLATFRFPAKLAIPASLGLALLGAAGVESLRQPAARRRLVAALGALAALALASALVAALDAEGLGASIDAAHAPGVRGPEAVRSLVPRFLHVALVAIGALVLAWRRPARLGPALVALVAVDLGFALAPAPLIPLVPSELLARAPRVAPVLVELAEKEGAPARVLPTASAQQRTEDERGAEVSGHAGAPYELALFEGLCPNSGVGRGVLGQDGFLANPPLRWATLDLLLRKVPPARRAILMGARYAYVRAGAEDSLGGPVARVANVGERALVRLEDAPAWASLHGNVRLASKRLEAVDLVLAPAFDPRRQAVLETGDALACDASLEDRGVARLDSPFRDASFAVAVDAPGPGWLVVREAFASGWRATVDGEERAIVAADVGFRAVHVDAGRHRVAFDYATPGLALGATISALAFVALVAAVAIARAGGRTGPRPV